VSVAVDPAWIERLRRSTIFQTVLRPAYRAVRGRTGRHAEAVPNGRANGGFDSPPPARRVVPTSNTPEARAIQERVDAIEWYHTIELPHGVVTPGTVDHRRQIERYGLPADMRGMRVLEVATFDGFFSFEMERRGASVVAVDVDSWLDCDIPRVVRQHIIDTGTDRPMGAGFRLAKELIGSQVDRRGMSIYELSPEKVGTFDLVFLSDLLIHLRDPLGGLESVFSVLRTGGTAIIAEPRASELGPLSGATIAHFEGFTDGVWWRPTVATLTALLRMAGFDRVEELARFRLDATWDRPVDKVVLKGHRAT